MCFYDNQLFSCNIQEGGSGNSTDAPNTHTLNESADTKDFNEKFKLIEERLSALTEINSQIKDTLDQQEIGMHRFKRYAGKLNGSLPLTHSTGSQLTKEKDISQDHSHFYRVETSASSIFHRFRWIITNASERIRHARNNPNAPLTSPVWSTHHGGYKVQVFIYLNGNGRCLRTHISVFMAFRSGHDNAFLKWPVRGTMSFFLLDQERKNSRLIARTVQSDPNSSSFSRPPEDRDSEMNVASGCPDFARISTLSDSKYVKNDTMFWEFSFDPSL